MWNWLVKLNDLTNAALSSQLFNLVELKDRSSLRISFLYFEDKSSISAFLRLMVSLIANSALRAAEAAKAAADAADVDE